MTKENDYTPLLVIITIIIVSSAALELSTNSGRFFEYFTGLFFVIFAMFKLFDVKAFANGFAKYDVITKKFRPYAYFYVFAELGLGVLYLANIAMSFTNIATMILMFISAYGVIKSIRSGMNLKCACLGTTLNVPLSTVSILENVGMGLMAFIMLAYNHKFL